jgi:hypothetical protein
VFLADPTATWAEFRTTPVGTLDHLVGQGLLDDQLADQRVLHHVIERIRIIDQPPGDPTSRDRGQRDQPVTGRQITRGRRSGERPPLLGHHTS